MWLKDTRMEWDPDLQGLGKTTGTGAEVTTIEAMIVEITTTGIMIVGMVEEIVAITVVEEDINQQTHTNKPKGARASKHPFLSGIVIGL